LAPFVVLVRRSPRPGEPDSEPLAKALREESGRVTVEADICDGGGGGNAGGEDGG
jgi:hypothetical protein